MLQSFPDLQVRPRNLAVDDRVAILEASLTGTNTGPLSLGETDRLVLGTQAETLPATGRSMDIRGAVVLEVADGLVVTERHYWLAGRRPAHPTRPDRVAPPREQVVSRQ